VPGGSIVGNRVLSFFPRGDITVTRTISQYSQDLVPYTNGVQRRRRPADRQQPARLPMYVHRRDARSADAARIVNLFDAAPGSPTFGKTTDGGPQISAVTYDGLVNYDGLVLSLQKQFSKRYQFGLSYTGSRARDNLLTGAGRVDLLEQQPSGKRLTGRRISRRRTSSSATPRWRCRSTST